MTEILKSLKELKPIHTPRYVPNKRILSAAQKLMLDCLLKGHGAYSKQYIGGLSIEEKRLIIYKCNTAYQVLNEAKQIKLNNTVRSILNRICPGLCGNAAEILTADVLDRNFQCDKNIKELYLSTEETVLALMKAKLLPEDFYSF